MLHVSGRKLRFLALPLAFLLYLMASTTAFAQSSAFTYQGRLTDNGNPATGVYDFEFRLFDAVEGGTQKGTTLTRTGVEVTNGTFSVQLEFAGCVDCFDGGARFLEISVRPAGGGSYTLLEPRQPVTSTPYAIKALDAARLGGQPASGFIQNTTTEQEMTNFNIGGSGTVAGTLTGGVVNAATQYQIGGLRMLAANGPYNDGVTILTASNTFLGESAGINTTPDVILNFLGGKFNSFFGANAGRANTIGNFNSFFGTKAGFSNTTGSDNSFFGTQAGSSNTNGSGNSFFGSSAGFANTNGGSNSFFGNQAGSSNTNGSGNSFFGTAAGLSNTTGNGNSFFGGNAGLSNTTGGLNSFFGGNAGASNTNGFNNSFFGRSAGSSNTTGSDNSFFGRSAGSSNTNGGGNSFFGTEAGVFSTNGGGNSFFGNQAGFLNTTGGNNSFFGRSAGSSNTTGGNNSFFGNQAGVFNTDGFNNTIIGSFANVGAIGLTNATAIGAHAVVAQSNSLVLGSINGVNDATASVNVGIGTTAPAERLHVVGNTLISGNGLIGGNVGVGTNAPATRLHVTGTGIIRARINSNDNAGLALTLNDQPKWSVAAVTGGQFQIFNDATGQNAFWIDSATNNVGIGNTAPADTLHVGGELRVNACVRNSGGTAIAGACPSDLRFKRDITPFPQLLDKLVRLRPVNYYWRGADYPDRHFGAGPSYGLIAQEVEQVLPELVSEDEQGYKAVNYSKLPLLTVQAVKELKAENNALRQTVTRQGQQLQEQEERLRRLEAAMEAMHEAKK